MGQACSVTPAQPVRKRSCVLEDIDGQESQVPWSMSQTCSVIQAKPERIERQPGLLEDTDDHDVQEWSRAWDKACGSESRDPARDWATGSEFEVIDRCCTMREEPEDAARYTGVLKPGFTVVLLRVAFDDHGAIWGLLNPPANAGWLSEGWAMLEGQAPDGESVLRLRRVSLGWEVGQAYRALEGTIVRQGAEVMSCQLCSLPAESIVEVLEFALVESRGRRVRLRAKVLTWTNREVGWISPRSEDGVQLLIPLRGEKLEMWGRDAGARNLPLLACGVRRGGA